MRIIRTTQQQMAKHFVIFPKGQQANSGIFSYGSRMKCEQRVFVWCMSQLRGLHGCWIQNTVLHACPMRSSHSSFQTVLMLFGQFYQNWMNGGQNKDVGTLQKSFSPFSLYCSVFFGGIPNFAWIWLWQAIQPITLRVLPPPFPKTLSVGSLCGWLRGMNPNGYNCHGWADELYNNWTFRRESSFCSAVPLKTPSHPSGERGSDRGEGRRTWVAETQNLLRSERPRSSRGQLPEKAAPVQTKSASQHASVACRGASHSLPVGTEEHQPAVMQSTSTSHCHALFCEVNHGACYT